MKENSNCPPDINSVWLDRMIVMLLIFVAFLVLAFLMVISDPDASLLFRESWLAIDLQGDGSQQR